MDWKLRVLGLPHNQKFHIEVLSASHTSQMKVYRTMSITKWWWKSFTAGVYWTWNLHKSSWTVISVLSSTTYELIKNKTQYIIRSCISKRYIFFNVSIFYFLFVLHCLSVIIGSLLSECNRQTSVRCLWKLQYFALVQSDWLNQPRQQVHHSVKQTKESTR